MEEFGAWIVSAILAGFTATVFFMWRREARRRSQERLRHHAYFDLLLCGIPDHSFVINRQGKIIAFNRPNVAVPLQLAARLEVAESLGDLFSAELVELVRRAADEACLAGSTITSTLEGDTNIKQSLQFWLTLLSGQDKDNAEFLLILRNVHELKVAEKIKDDFFSKISHEMRTPLTSISGALGLIAGGELEGLPEKVLKMVAIAHKNCQRLSRLVNDLLYIENISTGKLVLSERLYLLTPLLEAALESRRNFAESYGVSLVLMPQVADVELMIDSDVFLQVIDNLLSNAIKFSPESGCVEIHVNRIDGQLLRISVIDQGAGVAPDFRANIFNRFSHVGALSQHKEVGSGLGLAIAKELVELMGGSIGFECAEGSGTIFYVDFPQIQSLASLSQGGVTGDFEAKRILVIEDEVEVARLISLLLQQEGYRVDIALSGVEAMQALREFHYDAVTVDLLLPDFSGLEVIRRIRANAALAQVSIVVVSAKLEAGKLMYSGDTSTIEWLAKPIGRSQLLDAVEKRMLRKPLEQMLYVEDDADLQYVVRAMAEKNFHIVPASTLAQARSALATQSFDVVLLDIGLPDGSGWDLIQEIREKLPAARIVLLSGQEPSNSDLKKAEAVLLKSQITERQLLDALESIPKT